MLMFNGILWILKTGTPGRNPPKEFGSWQTVYKGYPGAVTLLTDFLRDEDSFDLLDKASMIMFPYQKRLSPLMQRSDTVLQSVALFYARRLIYFLMLREWSIHYPEPPLGMLQPVLNLCSIIPSYSMQTEKWLGESCLEYYWQTGWWFDKKTGGSRLPGVKPCQPWGRTRANFSMFG